MNAPTAGVIDPRTLTPEQRSKVGDWLKSVGVDSDAVLSDEIHVHGGASGHPLITYTVMREIQPKDYERIEAIMTSAEATSTVPDDE